MKTYKQLVEGINETLSLLEEVEQTDEGYHVMRNGQSISYHQDKESADKRAAASNMRGGSNATVVKDERGVKEEVEELDELSTDTLRKYRAKAKDDAYDAADVDDDRRLRKRSMGSWDAGKKILKRGDKLRAEEVEQTDEALKGNQHKIDANKNGKVDGHDFKILRNAKKARYQ